MHVSMNVDVKLMEACDSFIAVVKQEYFNLLGEFWSLWSRVASLGNSYLISNTNVDTSDPSYPRNSSKIYSDLVH